MLSNSRRFDLSEFLIHFFRRIDITADGSPSLPDHLGWGNVNEDVIYPPIFMLRCAIRNRRLWATWAVRNGARTIYGSRPAVCFTEMPIAAFLETSRSREAQGQAISQYAILLPKVAMFRRGANPVIYGLDARDARLPPGQGGGPRIMNDSLLPAMEQYRYVTFNPAATKPIDWTHEREWRWPYSGDLTRYQYELDDVGMVDDTSDMPGMDLTGDDLAGMGIIVRKKSEIAEVAHDVLALVDRDIVGRDHFQFVLCAEKVHDLEAIRDPEGVEQALLGATLDLASILDGDPKQRDALAQEFANVVAQVDAAHPEIECGEPGGCWLWLVDNTHALTRALLDAGRAVVSESGRYLAKLPEFSLDRGLQQRERMTRELATMVGKKYGLEAGYFSVLGKHSVDGVPFYNDDHLNNRLFYNVTWEAKEAK